MVGTGKVRDFFHFPLISFLGKLSCLVLSSKRIPRQGQGVRRATAIYAPRQWLPQYVILRNYESLIQIRTISKPQQPLKSIVGFSSIITFLRQQPTPGTHTTLFSSRNILFPVPLKISKQLTYQYSRCISAVDWDSSEEDVSNPARYLLILWSRFEMNSWIKPSTRCRLNTTFCILNTHTNTSRHFSR